MCVTMLFLDVPCSAHDREANAEGYTCAGPCVGGDAFEELSELS